MLLKKVLAGMFHKYLEFWKLKRLSESSLENRTPESVYGPFSWIRRRRKKRILFLVLPLLWVISLWSINSLVVRFFTFLFKTEKVYPAFDFYLHLRTVKDPFVIFYYMTSQRTSRMFSWQWSRAFRI